jgi:hypothetical protein
MKRTQKQKERRRELDKINREHIREMKRKWIERNRESWREYKRKYHLLHRDSELQCMKTWYLKNKGKRLIYAKEWHKKNKGYNKEWCRKKRLELIKKLGSKCCRCGYNKYLEVLEFHHLNSKEKENQNDFRRKGFDLSKVMLLCANCHKEQHLRKVYKTR